MPLSYNMGGTWKTVRYAYAHVNGSWKSVGQIWVKRSGTWYRIWTYSWTTGSWGSCSADCGGGTQTRSVTCTRNDGYTFDDSYCTTFGAGTKPSTSQSCNTDSCVVTECRYDESSYYWMVQCPSESDETPNPCPQAGYAQVRIMWGGNEFQSDSWSTSSCNRAQAHDSDTRDGYEYTKGSLQDTETRTSTTGTEDGTVRCYTTYYRYTVCRTPV